MPKEYFPRVKEAREALRERAMEVLETYLAIIAEARSAGDFESAFKAAQWLLEHMPNEDGARLIDPSGSKPKEIEGPKTGPSIQIGIALGGVKPKELPATRIIDITPDPDKNSE